MASASINGLAIASPTTDSTLTLCRCTAAQIASGSNFGMITAVSPPNRQASVATMAAPWMSGAGAMRTMPRPSMAPSAPWRDCAHSSSSGSPVMKSMPPPSVRQMSSWRHMTPFGCPVVPPV